MHDAELLIKILGNRPMLATRANNKAGKNSDANKYHISTAEGTKITNILDNISVIIIHKLCKNSLGKFILRPIKSWPRVCAAIKLKLLNVDSTVAIRLIKNKPNRPSGSVFMPNMG